MPTYQVVLCDGGNNELQDLTTVALDKKGSYRLNRPTVWTFRVPAGMCPQVRKGRRIKVRRDGAIVFNGIVMHVSREGDENTVWANVTAVDPMIWWAKRPLRDETGDFSKPVFTPLVQAELGVNTFGASIPTFRPITAAEILRRGIVNSEYWDDGVYGSLWVDTNDGAYDMDSPPAADLGIDDLADWPITIADFASMAINSGTTDIWVSPVDDDDGYDPEIMGVLNCVSQRGSALSAHLDFATGDFSISRIRHTEDLDTLCNRLWYYLGPPMGIQRYKASITATSGAGGGTGGAPPGSELESLIAASKAFYGVAMDVKIYDSGNEYLAKPMFLELWRTEALLRVNGQELLGVTPKPGAPYLPFTGYNLGDTIGIDADPDVLGYDLGADATVRIYGFDVEPDREGVERVAELVVSADGG